MTNLRLRRALGVAVSTGGAVALLGACTFPVRFATPAEVALAKAPPSPVTVVAPAAPPAPGGLTQIQADLRSLIAQVGPMVVRIDAGAASGSGLLLDSQGTVVTPATLVASATQVTVTTAAGQQYSGTVIASDPASDIAVVRVTGASGLTAVTFGDSGTVQVGDVVVAVGHQVAPSGTASQGIVSGIATGQIQTTAPMAAGTSGSALVNITGQVIGMTTLGAAGSPGPGVAIPSNQVTAVAQRLLAGGSGTKASHLGVTVADAPGGGVLVQSVVPAGPAATAGVQTGWTIIGIGGRSVPNSAALAQILSGYTSGQRVVLTVRLPSGSTRSISVVLGP